MIFAIVWGALAYVGGVGVESAVGNNTPSNVDNYNTVVTDFNATRTTINNALTKAQLCNTVPCLRHSHEAAAASLSSFNGDLQGMSLPPNASASARVEENDTHTLATTFNDLAHSSSNAAYRSTFQNSNLTTVLRFYPQHTQNLLNDIRAAV
jgi:hypothetical protein